MTAVLVTEIVMTFMFLIIILGATDKRAPKGFAGLAIGLGLTLIHLISIPVSNTSVNPARSTSQAIFVGGWAVEQLWMFWLAPLAPSREGETVRVDVSGLSAGVYFIRVGDKVYKFVKM
jgi:aquaporin Z